MAPKFHASLVDPSFHAPALLQLVALKPNLNVYLYFANKATDVVSRALHSSQIRRALPRSEDFRLFATKFFTSSSRIGMNVILTALVIMHRADEQVLRQYIEGAIEMQPCHLVFLGSILVAVKAVNESIGPIRNVLQCTSFLTTEAQVRAYEIDLLKIVDYKINVTEAELLHYYHDVQSCYSPRKSSHVQSSSSVVYQPQIDPALIPCLAAHYPSTSTISRTSSKPKVADPIRSSRSHSDMKPRIKRHHSTHGASAYPTPHPNPPQYLEPAKVKVHRSGTRSRAHSFRPPPPTPYYQSHRPHQDTLISVYPTPPSLRPAPTHHFPVIPPPSQKLQRSKSHATFRSRDGKQESSSSWKKLFFIK